LPQRFCSCLAEDSEVIFLRKSFTLCGAILMAATIAQAGGFKKFAGEFLYNGVGSRALGMGSAYVAVANDVTAGYWNPAGLAEAEGFQAQFMHSQQFISSVQYDYLGLSRKFENGATMGLSVLRLGVDDIADSRNALIGESLQTGYLDYSKISYFNTADYAFILSYANRYNDNLSYGANIKLIYRDYSIESALGIGFDAGVRYRILPGFIAALIVRDITTTMMAWSTDEKEFITPSLRPGISYQYLFESIGLYLQPSFDVNLMFENRKASAQMHLGPISADTFWGMEAGYRDVVFLRAGYDDLERFNGGIGLSITRFAIDYSYTNYDQELGNVHRISFHLKLR